MTNTKYEVIINKIVNEMEQFKKEMLLKDKDTIFNRAFKIVTYETAEMFFTHSLYVFTEIELKFLESAEDILVQFYDYYSCLESGDIDEDMIKEFLTYSIENINEDKMIV